MSTASKPRFVINPFFIDDDTGGIELPGVPDMDKRERHIFSRGAQYGFALGALSIGVPLVLAMIWRIL